MTVMDMTERFKKLKKFHNAVQLEIHDNQGQYPELCFLKEEDLDYVLDLLNTGKMRISNNNPFRKNLRRFINKEYKKCKPLSGTDIYDSETAARKRLLKEIATEFKLWGEMQ